MSAELKRYIDDKSLLKQYIGTDTVSENGTLISAQNEEVPPIFGIQENIVRPVIRLLERNIVLTRIHPEVLFSTIKIGIGIGRTMKEARSQAAENALRSLARRFEPLAPFPLMLLTSHHQLEQRTDSSWEEEEEISSFMRLKEVAMRREGIAKVSKNRNAGQSIQHSLSRPSLPCYGSGRRESQVEVHRFKAGAAAVAEGQGEDGGWGTGSTWRRAQRCRLA
ncbi:C-terminal domain phosphatase-like [Musa troglodytarum]|uniref:C-terminal domain phosphatase-like n=1 Tax=Musa troglodytarum TaxID=320322 RepID=A0A9E7JIH4_9LILI|nr:C-terminal domain phosphatase-like [Musa troglodytarum]